MAWAGRAPIRRAAADGVVSASLMPRRMQSSGALTQGVASGGATATDSVPAVGFAATWGVLGVMSILANGMRRILPVALEPFKRGDFGAVQWAAYAAFALFMAYAEGIKGFQHKFCPFVVKRATLLGGPRSTLGQRVLAPPFCMGLFHASKKRKIVSWSLVIGVFGIIQVAKRLPYPFNAIVDGGAVVGLAWGCISLAITYGRALFGKAPAVSPELPEKSNY